MKAVKGSDDEEQRILMDESDMMTTKLKAILTHGVQHPAQMFGVGIRQIFAMGAKLVDLVVDVRTKQSSAGGRSRPSTGKDAPTANSYILSCNCI